ncbi:MAG: FAD-dependent thymidylate synthase [Christensenellales bacterium]
MPEVKQSVTLLSFTPDAEQLAAMGAKLCYSPSGIEDIKAKLPLEKSKEFIAHIVDIGHLSTIEHASFTFGIEGVSRTLLAQITRHRIASFSVQSQRYVSYSANGFGYVVPPAIRDLGADAVQEFERQMQTMQQWYGKWRYALGCGGEQSNEDARFVLPGACETRMMLTMNARELLHFFTLRCCNRAQWEIRALAWSMLKLVINAAPALFESAGPACVRGACGEGKKSCGEAAKIRKYQKAFVKGAL